MSLLVFSGSVEQGLIYGLVALALLVSYRVLDIADLTVDGSFTLGAGASAMLVLAGHPLLGLLVAPLAGALAGVVTALLQTKCKVAPILAGIITMTALYSINLMVMGGRSNLQLLRTETVFTAVRALLGDNVGPLVLLAVLDIAVCALLGLFLRTRTGLAVRATGDNPAMVRASSINPAVTTLIGLAIANALVGLAGGLIAQYQQFTEVGGGTGTVVLGLASLIIGEVITGRSSMPRRLAGAIVGAIVYRLILALALSASVTPQNLKLVSAIIVAAAISAPAIKQRVQLAQKKRKAVREHAARH